jgi:hypothetical protein
MLTYKWEGGISPNDFDMGNVSLNIDMECRYSYYISFRRSRLGKSSRKIKDNFKPEE